MSYGAPPHNLIAQVGCAKDRVHQHPQITIGPVITMDIDTAVRLQHPPAFQQPGGHKCNVSSIVFAGAGFHCFNHGVNLGIIIGDASLPVRMHIGVPAPHVSYPGFANPFVVLRAVSRRQFLFFRQFRLGDRWLWLPGESLVGGKGRVNGNQVNALVVERPYKPQVVHDRQGAVGNVQLGHQTVRQIALAAL